MTLRVLELFGGIGACTKALERLGIDHEVVDYVEIDKYAVKSFNAVHGTNFEPQDIKEWNKDIDVDLIMHGSPCQDFSVAGKGAGGDKDSGTRSSLMYETLRIVEKLKPKYVIWENVKNLLSKKHIHNFEAYQEAMRNLGYTNYYQVLNAKDYGVPQNRERVFTVSIRETITKATFLPSGKTIDRPEKFKFPEPFPLEKKLKDILDTNVDEKYYLSDKQMEGMINTSFHSYNIKALLKDEDGEANCLKARFEGNPQLVSTGGTEIQRKVYNEAVRKGLVKPNDVIEYTFSKARLEEIENGSIRKQNKIDNSCMSTLKCHPQQLGVCVEDAYCVASRGRGEKGNIEQHLEARYDGATNTLTSVQKDNYIAVKTANKQGYDMAKDGDGIDLAYPNSTTRRGRVGHEVSKTLACSDTMGTYQNYRIRKLTPKECWRLMGFDDSDFEKAEKVNSNSQLYKQAGNSIVVNVLEGILGELLGWTKKI